MVPHAGVLAVGGDWHDRVVRAINDEQRRARLATRHGIGHRGLSVEGAVDAMTCLHSTEPPTVFLSVAARSDATREDIGRALYNDRSVVKQLAMRRTLFVFPRELLPAVWGSAAARIAGPLRTRFTKEIEAAAIADDGEAWVSSAFDGVLRCLAEDGPSTTAELRARLPELDRRVEVNPGKPYGGVFPLAPRVLVLLGATGRIVRGANAGDWRVSRPRWTLTEDWLGEPPSRLDSDAGYLELVRRWLTTFGPGTEADLVWWLGGTKGGVRHALGDLGAVEVQLSDGIGYLLPDDLDDVPVPEPWAALLPVLDPTLMGWKQRGFYLDPEDVPFLFDTNGNGGTTAWWDGRVVGCWVQDPDGVVRVVLRRDVGSEATRALEEEAERLTRWLDGDVVSSVYASLQMKSARLP